MRIVPSNELQIQQVIFQYPILFNVFDTNRRIKLKLSKEELPYKHILAKGVEKMIVDMVKLR